MGQAGRKWVTDHFDWTVVAGRAEELFQNRFRDNARQFDIHASELSDRI
jgi:hypothetical protein